MWLWQARRKGHRGRPSTLTQLTFLLSRALTAFPGLSQSLQAPSPGCSISLPGILHGLFGESTIHHFLSSCPSCLHYRTLGCCILNIRDPSVHSLYLPSLCSHLHSPMTSSTPIVLNVIYMCMAHKFTSAILTCLLSSCCNFIIVLKFHNHPTWMYHVYLQLSITQAFIFVPISIFIQTSPYLCEWIQLTLQLTQAKTPKPILIPLSLLYLLAIHHQIPQAFYLNPILNLCSLLQILCYHLDNSVIISSADTSPAVSPFPWNPFCSQHSESFPNMSTSLFQISGPPVSFLALTMYPESFHWL